MARSRAMNTDWLAETNDAGQKVYTAIYGDMENGIDMQCWEFAGEWHWNCTTFDGVTVADGTAPTLRDAKRSAISKCQAMGMTTGAGKSAMLHGMGFVPVQRGKG